MKLTKIKTKFACAAAILTSIASFQVFASDSPEDGATYIIQSALHNNLYLSTGYGSGKQQAIAVVDPKYATNSDAFVWELVEHEDDWFTLEQDREGNFLDVQWGSARPQTPMWIWPGNDGIAQKFKFKKASNGYYEIIPKVNPSLRLDVKWGSTNPGTHVWTYAANNGAAQKWRLYETEAISHRHCSRGARNALQGSVGFMKRYRSELLDDFKIADRRITERRIKRRFDRKMDKIRFSCAERVLCKPDARRIAMHPGGIAGNRIRICYDKMVRARYSYCDLVGTVVHEFGHAIGIKKDRLGGHGRNRNDRVYQFGWHARDLCERDRSIRDLALRN